MQTPTPQPGPTPQTITTEQATAAQALLNRAETGMLSNVLLHGQIKPSFDFWQGYAKAAHDLRGGAAQKLATKDAQLGGYEPPRFQRAATRVLGVDIHRLTRVEIEQRLAQAGIKVPFDTLALSDVETTLQLEDGAIPAVNLDDEHAVARVDANDGASLHGESLVVVGMDIVADGYTMGPATPAPTQQSTWRTKPARGMGGLYHHIEGFSTGRQLLHVGEHEARLIAAAPELLAAAIKAEAVLTKARWLDSAPDPEAVALRALRAAIASATGVSL